TRTFAQRNFFMTLYLSPEQKQAGQANFQEAVGRNLSRRDFLKGILAAGAVAPISAAAYYGYKQLEGNPVKAGLIGAGDEGGVLVGNHNPDYLQFIAFSDIRPFNQRRIFEGDPPANPPSPRKALNAIYRREAKEIKSYPSYKD